MRRLLLLFCLGWGLLGSREASAQTKFRYPMTTSGTYITAYYDNDRASPGLRDWNGGSKTYDNHSGSDYGIGGFTAMDRGVWIVAGADGVVDAASDGAFDRCTSGSCGSCNGNYVRIRHADGKLSYYLHMKTGTVKVRTGQTVKCGDQLGMVGSSGCSTGPHLHFQVNSSPARDPFLNSDWVSRGSYLGHPSEQCANTTPPPPPPPPDPNCTHVKTVRLAGSSVNIRPGSNTSQAALGSVPEGTCLKVDAVDPSGQEAIAGNGTKWYKITYNGVSGWIYGYYADCSTCGGPPPECTDGQKRSCYTGPAGTQDKGICKAGEQTCGGGKWGGCSGEVKPKTESCNGQDDNCDGATDEGNPGGGQTCQTGQKGPCGEGTSRCDGGKIVCEGGQQPSQEICDGIDNDCNGQVDDGLLRQCYTGPANTNGIGICQGGSQTCTAGKWGVCASEILPEATDTCGDGKDNNCNGQTDEGCSTPACQDGQTQPCYTGPAAVRGIGECKPGSQTCAAGQWGACQGDVQPASSEVCGDGKDNNCNGLVDEGCGNQPGDCVDKDGDGYGVGAGCKGAQDCDDNDPAVNPAASEVCGDGKDNDCKDGDVVCGKIPVGEEGCRKPSDCESNFCVSLEGLHRCSQACKDKTDCPSGYTCVQNQACWPDVKKTVPSGETVKPCKDQSDCTSGTTCTDGFCLEAKGCSCSQAPEETGLPSLLIVLLALLAFVSRRKHA